MRKGLVILKPPLDTLELRALVRARLEGQGFTCESRARFDGVMIFAFLAPAGAEVSDEEVRSALRAVPLLAEVAVEIKALE